VSESKRKPERRGWGWPAFATKAHYFVGAAPSLCGRWMFWGVLEDDKDDLPVNCKECRHRLAKEGNHQ
jgi:hypothetical protein